MKIIGLVLLLTATLLPLRAHDILANGDFADGAAHWHGDGKPASESGGDLTQGLAPGLVIKLDPEKWTKISQTFNTREDHLDFSITYKTSADCAFAKDPTSKMKQFVSVADLAELTGFRYTNPINLNPGSWLLMMNDPSAHLMTYYMLKPVLGGANSQTQTGDVPRLAAHEEKTLILAFPPGTGTITISKIVLTPHAGAPTP